MNRLRLLLNDFRAYSEVSTTHTAESSFDVGALLRRALRAWQAEFETVDALVRFDVSPLRVQADAQQIQIVMEHLVGNALKYRDSERQLNLDVSASEVDGIVQICVADNGIGIDPSFHSSIFGLFKRLHASEEYPGTGLGLAVCQRIIEMHGQRLWVESQPGRGSTFCFTLRKAEPQYVS